MEVKINKEIRDYTESIFFGLSIRQCFFSIIACIVAVVIYFMTNDILGKEITSWLCILGALPFASLGFVTFQGMTAEEVFITAIKSMILTHTELPYVPVNLYDVLLKPLFEKFVKEDSVSYDKKLRKTKKKRKSKI